MTIARICLQILADLFIRHIQQIVIDSELDSDKNWSYREVKKKEKNSFYAVDQKKNTDSSHAPVTYFFISYAGTASEFSNSETEFTGILSYINWLTNKKIKV